MHASGNQDAVDCAAESCVRSCNSQGSSLQACIDGRGAEGCENACRGYTTGEFLQLFASGKSCGSTAIRADAAAAVPIAE